MQGLDLLTYARGTSAHECGHMVVLFKKDMLVDLNFLPHETAADGIKGGVYLNEDYSVSTYTRKVAEQLQAWLLQRGVATQLLLQEVHGKGQAPDYRTPLSNFAPVYDDCDGVTELPTI